MVGNNCNYYSFGVLLMAVEIRKGGGANDRICEK